MDSEPLRDQITHPRLNSDVVSGPGAELPWLFSMGWAQVLRTWVCEQCTSLSCYHSPLVEVLCWCSSEKPKSQQWMESFRNCCSSPWIKHSETTPVCAVRISWCHCRCVATRMTYSNYREAPALVLILDFSTRCSHLTACPHADRRFYIQLLLPYWLSDVVEHSRFLIGHA